MAKPDTLYWEDIDIGRTLKTGLLDIDAPGIRSFAEKFDPQPYHLDRDAAEASLFGGLCASGWHVSAMMMKLISEELIKENIALVGSKKVPWLEWYRPVFEGDTISATATITDKAEADGETDCGLVGFDIDVHNQNDKKVMALSAYLMIERKEAAHV
ncbi:MAG: MaoC/PaaZ C-terminal domain-containing protein [Alphaproteobacteria bacterium]